jgi:hypothetical protein
MSSALKTTPARAVEAVAATVRTAAFSSVCSEGEVSGGRGSAAGGGVAAEGPRDDEEGRQRGGEDAERHCGLAARDPDRHRDWEAEPRDGLEQH